MLLPLPVAGGRAKPEARDAGAPHDAGLANHECKPGSFCPAPSDADAGHCGQLELTMKAQTVLERGNLLVVFDRSGSMEALWGTSAKYRAAGDALLAAITPLQQQLTVGGVFFPSAPPVGPDPNCPSGCEPGNLLHWLPGIQGCCLTNALTACSVSAIDATDQIDFTPAERFIAGLPTQWHIPNASGTPLEAGLLRAADAIRTSDLAGPLLIFVMTDGEPNCGTDEERVITQVKSWRAKNIKTYVVGLPGASGAADLLNAMAQAGGSGHYIEPRNPEELETKLREVLSVEVRPGFASCNFTLTPSAEATDKLELLVTQRGKERAVKRRDGQTANYHINDVGTEVTLEGELCEQALTGELDSLRFVYGCPDPPPPEPELQ